MIEQVTFAEIEADPAFAGLLVEYAAESGNRGLPEPKIEPETYRRLDAAGVLTIFAARVDGRLVGFIFILVSVNPHYSVPLGTSESFFVAKAHRMTGLPLRLLRAAEDLAREKGAKGIYVNTPFGSSLCETLPRLEYVETNRVFFRSLSDA